MRSMEAIGVLSGFPHPADLYEIISSKSWMAILSLWPGSQLPAATMVSKGSVVVNAPEAARQALATLDRIRRTNPFPVQPGDAPAPSAINKDGVRRGVVKLGWSWENRFVLGFTGVEQLQQRLLEMLTLEGCTANSCIVQEWVDFDFEMRLYFLPPKGWTTSTERLEPAQIECNSWGERDESRGPGANHAAFHEISKEACLNMWAGDHDCWNSAVDQAKDLGQRMLCWLLANCSQQVPMIRLDFMLKRLGPGQARVFFGEYCEMGACCLTWKEGPPTIWRAALDAILC